MKYATYGSYKPSGIPWIGNMPAHWIKTKFAYAFSSAMGQTILKEELTDEGLPVFSATEGDHYFGKLENPSVRLSPGDLVIPARGNSIGSVKLVTESATSTQTTIYCKKMSGSISSEFVYWFSVGMRDHLFGFTQTAIPQITVDQVNGNPLLAPPVHEQQTIARFLDAKTAQIDELIAKKRQLIDKLKEKRQALIARTVTRGLPPEAAKAAGLEPNPEMRDSGVEWLGEIPVHWATPPLYARYSVELGKMLSEAKITGEHLIPYLRNIDVQWNVINYHDLPQMDIPPAEYSRYTIRTGDLLVCEGGEVGRAAIVAEVDGVIGYQKALHRLRALRADEDQQFMCLVLEWAARTGIFNAGGTSTIAHLTGEQLRKYRFPKPPKTEQRLIVQYLQRETEKIRLLQSEVDAAITRLTEYRQALITSAVTGKIDVRGLV